MDRGAWPFLVGGVTCLSDLVSVCAEREDEREDKGEKRQEKRRGEGENEKRRNEKRREEEMKTPLCVRSKRLRVYGQDVSVCTVNRPECPRHSGLLPVHTETS